MPNGLDPLGLFDPLNRDAQRLDRLLQFGTPARPPAPTSTPSQSYGDLVRSMREEEEATRVYRERAARADAAGDTTSAELWHHIAQEEDDHRARFWTRIGQVYGR
ncbi:MAG: ferritin family protein [Chloroflexota bacterium]|nr:ferritin family protein [Chloroflexota bacterium]